MSTKKSDVDTLYAALTVTRVKFSKLQADRQIPVIRSRKVLIALSVPASVGGKDVFTAAGSSSCG